MCRSVGGVKVSIVAFQAIDLGSIPGRRNYYFVLFLFSSLIIMFTLVILYIEFNVLMLIPVHVEV